MRVPYTAVEQRVDAERVPGGGVAQVADVARAAALAERQRLARDLHDSVTQTLISLHLTSQAAADLWDTQPTQARAAHLRGGGRGDGAHPRSAEPTDLTISHLAYDRTDALRDINLVFPLQRLRELQAE